MVHTFTYKNLYYELETVLEPHIGLTVLAVEVDPRQPIELPPFIRIKALTPPQRMVDFKLSITTSKAHSFLL